MRRIRNDEIPQVARIMAQGFSEYPLYQVFFPEDEKKIKRIFYFFWYRIYTRQNFTYITDQGDIAVSFQKPEDRIKSSLGLWLNPRFLFGFLAAIPLKSLLLVSEFGKMEEVYQKQFYNPLTDSYAQAICVLKNSRGDGRIFQVLKELDDGRPVYCETHTPENVKLYQHLGLELCQKTEWQGVPHYVMKKTGDYVRVGGPLQPSNPTIL